MLRNRFSVALLALLLATAMPGSVSAADTSNDTTSQVNAPILQSVPAGGDGEVQTVDLTFPDVIPPGQMPLEAIPQAGSEESTDVQAPGEVAEPVMETQEPPTGGETSTGTDSEEDGTASGTPSVEPEGTLSPEEPTVTEPAIVVAPEGIAPEEPTVTEPAIVVEPEVIVPSEPVVTEPAIIVDELVTEPAIVLEEVVTEPAIIVEPVAAILTINYHGEYAGVEETMTEIVEGYSVGDTVDLAAYIDKILAQFDLIYIGEIENVTVDNAEMNITLNFTLDANKISEEEFLNPSGKGEDDYE